MRRSQSTPKRSNDAAATPPPVEQAAQPVAPDRPCSCPWPGRPTVCQKQYALRLCLEADAATAPPRIDEQAAFEEDRRALGWVGMTDPEAGCPRLARHIFGKTWVGDKETMPAYRSQWTEAQWLGWKARSALHPQRGSEPLTEWSATALNSLMNAVRCHGSDKTNAEILADRGIRSSSNGGGV